jgi:hypothetical protein
VGENSFRKDVMNASTFVCLVGGELTAWTSEEKIK